jgi:hypothetical protein
MIIHTTEFIEGKNYVELSPKQGLNKYRFITLKPLIVHWCGYCPPNVKISFRGQKNKEWLYMDEKHFIIMKDYAWDGCTPKKYVPVLGWMGTKDTPETILPSLIHDVFCQFIDTEHFPFNRKVNNDIFLHLLERNEFRFARLYYNGASLWSKVGPKGINKDVYSIIIDK